ncbi:MAG: MBL fold metallo-hydrolase [Alphaproteobacteria bacterium]|uniref:Putative quorum-quenching lactonase YtnP n=1 Tax=Brevundimonas mediterranea TaxID=74329 RepID=A0A7Z9C670_9CAUL|nr:MULTISPECIES: MBL fold metallo-hydrolase [Brevundimonas]MBU4196479.1 MBL fold metallo-hydrolase [Alphaproteobacteria bacterium]MBU4238996.1 MBL fold metallo-hydrolase [Alphaproteobacteria bacterium]MCG2664462.1 MBL fold metallo-hydrolase [Brevundimonas sp.]VDC50702.1 putative quorum-quenching lactonase YtnP [Brevundimonas mediterranea]
MRILMATAAVTALTLAACSPAANDQKSGEPAPPNPTQTVAAPAEKPVYRFKIGALDAIALFDGQNPVPNDNKVFGVGLTPQAVAAPLTAAGQPADPIMLEIHPLLVRNGDRTMLFDAGLGAGKGQLMQSLQTAGVDPANITDVMISHGHPDHVGGLVADGAPAFPNAAIRMSEAEWASIRANPEMADLVRVITPKVQAFRPDEEVAPGVEAQDTAGHTPGHVAYLITDGQNQLLYTGDLMHHWVLSVEHPDWTVGYDDDATAGKKARLDEITALRASGAHIYAYHFPFPGLGKIQTREGRATFISEAQPAA